MSFHARERSIPGSGICGSHGLYICDFEGHCPCDHHSGRASLYFHRALLEAVPSRPYQHGINKLSTPSHSV